MPIRAMIESYVVICLVAQPGAYIFKETRDQIISSENPEKIKQIGALVLIFVCAFGMLIFATVNKSAKLKDKAFAAKYKTAYPIIDVDKGWFAKAYLAFFLLRRIATVFLIPEELA